MQCLQSTQMCFSYRTNLHAYAVLSSMRKELIREQGVRGALVDNGEAAGGALNGAALSHADASEAARHVAGLDGHLAIHRQRAVAVAGSCQGPLQSSTQQTGSVSETL